MRIALVTRIFSESWGGMERVGVNIAEVMSKKGHDVRVYAQRVEYSGRLKVEMVPCIKTFSALRLLSFKKNVRKLLTLNPPDIVISLVPFYPLDIYRAGGGVHEHWMRIRYPNPLLRAIKYITSPVHLAMRWLEKKIMDPKNHSLIIANSRLVKGHIESYYGIDEKFIRVVYNGINKEVFNPEVKRYRNEARKILGIGHDEIAALYVSNNWKRKGLSTILKALAAEKGITVVVVGRGKKRRFLKLIKELGIKESSVIFAGTTKKIEEFYGACDFFVLPTLYDPSSNACLEAMSCGLPVVTTRSNGASEFIDDGENGFILENWDDDNRLKGFFEALKNKDLRERMGRLAMEKVRDFTWEKTTREIIEACETVYERKRALK